MKNKNFTVISNNCWAGAVYEDMNMEYKTPTVGLFFYAPCYIHFLSDIRTYTSVPIVFIALSKYNEANVLRNKKWYPIGVINSVEIHFLHYTSEDEAKEKWERRCKRIQWNNVFVKMCDRDLCDEFQKQAFLELPYNKVFFTAKKTEKNKYVIYLPEYKNVLTVGDLYNYRWVWRKRFDVVKWLNDNC